MSYVIGVFTSCIAGAVTLSVLHLFLFLLQPKRRLNGYFAMLSAAFAAVATIDAMERVADVRLLPILGHPQRTAVSILILATARFSYALFDVRAPRRFWIYVVLNALLVFGAGRNLAIFGRPVIILGLIIIADACIVLVRRWRELQHGRWLLALGIIVLAIGGAMQMIGDLVGHPLRMLAPYLWGGVVMLFVISIYLAYSFARNEAENARKTAELEDARQLQLALLPSRVPDVPGLEIAASMRTATEVGGDFYDFRVDDGTLIVGIADAVGHGARAGALVTAMKGLFQLVEGAPAAELQRFSRAIRGMGLPRTHIALALARFANGSVEIASAGMPPPLLLRGNDVTEIDVGGVPLGGPADFVYRSQRVELARGDLLLLFSDGLPELTDSDGAPFGYVWTRDLAARVPRDSAEAALESILEVVGDAPPDDVTIIAIRVA